MQSLQVELGNNSYPILIADTFNHSNFQQQLIQLCQHRPIVVISNSTVYPLFSSHLSFLTHTLTYLLPDGEQYKNFEHYQKICQFLAEQHCPRDTLLIALGGGVVGDITGFVAATYLRGIDFVQIPTTLLAQVDSSVGGKTAINLSQGKNLVGAFKQPKAVFIILESLASLPDTEFNAGMAEVIKYGLIYDDDFFEQLITQQSSLLARHPALLSQIIYRCCEIKAKIVSLDETEQNLRAILNYGHTFGHAIESYTGHKSWLHGQAVAVGLLIAGLLSVQRHHYSTAQLHKLYRLLLAFNLPTQPPAEMTTAHFWQWMQVDKKVLAGKLRLIVLEKLGQAKILSEITEPEITQLINDFNHYEWPTH